METPEKNTIRAAMIGKLQTETIAQAYERHANWFVWGHGLSGLAVGGGIGLATMNPLWAIFAALMGLAIGIYRKNHAACDLSDWQIHSLGSAVIQPYNPELVEPDSYDATLGGQFHQILPDGTSRTVDADEIVIEPGECWLAHTIETFNFPSNLKGTLQGKSSWARLALFVECAGLFDKGFQGTAVLEFYNAGKWGTRLKKGDKIAQMSFHRTLPACAPYGHPLRKSHYQNQEGARASWLAKNDRICVNIPEPTP